MKIVENKKGFKVIQLRTVELMEVCTGSMGICDYCNDATFDGYYIAVLNCWYCEKCYQSWLDRAINYPEDQKYETANFQNMMEKIKGAGIGE